MIQTYFSFSFKKILAYNGVYITIPAKPSGILLPSRTGRWNPACHCINLPAWIYMGDVDFLSNYHPFLLSRKGLFEMLVKYCPLPKHLLFKLMAHLLLWSDKLWQSRLFHLIRTSVGESFHHIVSLQKKYWPTVGGLLTLADAKLAWEINSASGKLIGLELLH